MHMYYFERPQTIWRYIGTVHMHTPENLSDPIRLVQPISPTLEGSFFVFAVRVLDLYVMAVL